MSKPVRTYRMVDLDESLARIEFAITVYTVPHCGKCDRVVSHLAETDLGPSFHLFRCLMDKRDAGQMFKKLGSLDLPIVSLHANGKLVHISPYGEGHKLFQALELIQKERVADFT